MDVYCSNQMTMLTHHILHWTWTCYRAINCWTTHNISFVSWTVYVVMNSNVGIENLSIILVKFIQPALLLHTCVCHLCCGCVCVFVLVLHVPKFDILLRTPLLSSLNNWFVFLFVIWLYFPVLYCCTCMLLSFIVHFCHSLFVFVSCITFLYSMFGLFLCFCSVFCVQIFYSWFAYGGG